MADALQTYGTSGNLKVLTAGTERQSMQAMCNNGAIERLLEVVRNEYDIVLLDTCPVLPVADTRSLIKYSDGVFLTLVRDLSRLPLVSDACGILKSYRAKLMGGIIIGVNAIGYAKHYYPQSRGAKAIESKKDSSADPVAS